MQARLRAQLGDRSKYSGERRRRSVVVASIVFDHNRPSTRLIPSFVQSPSCAHSLLRSFIRLHGVNHNQPFPTATSLHKTSTSSFTIFIVFQCSRLWHVELGGDYRSVAQRNWLFSTLFNVKSVIFYGLWRESCEKTIIFV